MHRNYQEPERHFMIKVNPLKHFPPLFLVSSSLHLLQNPHFAVIVIFGISRGAAQPPGPPLPPARGGVPQSSTTPWPSRTDTALLILVLELSTSASTRAAHQETAAGRRNPADPWNPAEPRNPDLPSPVCSPARSVQSCRRGCSARGRVTEFGMKGIHLQGDNWADPVANFVLLPGFCYPALITKMEPMT